MEKQNSHEVGLGVKSSNMLFDWGKGRMKGGRDCPSA